MKEKLIFFLRNFVENQRIVMLFSLLDFEINMAHVRIQISPTSPN